MTTPREFVLTNAKLFTATGKEAIDNGAVWVDGEHIRYAGPASDLPAAAQKLPQKDVGGRFIMPGMTESHAHLSFTDQGPFELGMPTAEAAMMSGVRNARVMLGSGFTSALSFGSAHKIDVHLRDAINSGYILGPRMAAAGRDVGTTGANVDSGADGGLSRIADGPWELRKVVREQRRDLVDVVKIFLDGENINPRAPAGELSFTDEEVVAICEEAHRHNMRVACHSRGADAVKQAVRAGVDYIGHANYLDDEAVQMLADAKDRLFVGPAIAWEITYVEKSEQIGVPKHVPVDQGYVDEIEASRQSVPKLHKAGVRLMIGGDYGINIAPHGAYAKDLEYFVTEFGMSEADALLCATANGGAAVDPKGRVGTLEDGKYADLVVVDGDPLKDITVLQDHSKLLVMKGGQFYRDLIRHDIYNVDADQLFPDVGGGKKQAAE